MVDMSPHALRQRMRHGNVYPPERAEQALRSFFREGNLNALRELALRRVASAVEQDLEEYMRDQPIDAAWPAGQGVAVVADASPGFGHLLRRAWRSATALNAPLTVIWVEPSGWGRASPEERAQLEENLRLADDLGADVVRHAGSDPREEIMRVVRERNVESIYVSRPAKSWWRRLTGRPNLASRLLDEAGEVDVHVVSHPTHEEPS